MKFIAVLLMFLISVNVYAREERDYFIELSLGETKYPWNGNAVLEERGANKISSWSIGGGMAINRNLLFIISYVDLGTRQKNTRPVFPPYSLGPFAEMTSETSTISLALLPQFNITEQISLFGELGRHWWTSEVNTIGVIYKAGIFNSFSGQTIKSDGNDRFLSLGAKYAINSKYHCIT